MSGNRTARIARRILAGVMLLCAWSNASADVTLRLARLSDTEAVLIGSGTLGTVVPASNSHALFLIDPFVGSPNGNNWVLEESELDVGPSYRFNFANDMGTDTDADAFLNTLYVGRVEFETQTFPQIPSNEPLVGTMFLRLEPNGATFAPIGSTGQVYWGTTTGDIRGVLSGTWEIVAAPVPEPMSVHMMLGGLALLALLGKRRGRTFNQAMR